MRLSTFLLACLCVFALPCIAEAKKLDIVATTGQVGDIVENIAGEHANVTVLMGPGIDPHLYRLNRYDMSQILGADLVLYNGVHLEGKMTETLEDLAQKGKNILPVASYVPVTMLIKPQKNNQSQLTYDPHIWMDAKIWQVAAGGVRDLLIRMDPEHAGDYQKNAKRYIDQLGRLDLYAKQTIASIPKISRVLVTAHDAFHYLGKAYGIEVIGVQGLSTESEMGLHEIEQLAQEIATRKIKAIFPESNLSERPIRAIVEGVKANGHNLDVGGILYADAMGAADSYEGTYVGMMDHNITTIVKALGGQVPKDGFKGLAQ